MPDTTNTLSRGTGWRKDQLDPRDHIYGVEHAPTALPLKASIRQQMPAPYDQGQLGSCTGNAIAGAMEFNQIQAGQEPVTPSRLFIYWHERDMENTVNEDAGAEIRDGLKVVANVGVPPETDWPYDIDKFRDKPSVTAEYDATQHKAWRYARLNPLVGAPIRSAIHSKHPVVFGFSVPYEFEELSGPNSLLHMPNSRTRWMGGHAVCVTGYDFTRQNFPVNVVEVRNSWGTDWGDSGYFYMDSAWFMNPQLTSDFWVIRKAS